MAEKRDTSNDVNMTRVELIEWLKRHHMDEFALAEVLGCTRQAVVNWVRDERGIPEPIGRLLNYFDNYPDRMGYF